MGFFLGTQERVRNSRGKRAISVRATEVLLYWLGLASDANFICAVATTFDAPFYCWKKTKTTTTKFAYSLLKSSVYVINKIRDLTNSNDMHLFFWHLIERKNLLLVVF